MPALPMKRYPRAALAAAKVDRDEERRMLERAMVRIRTLRAMVNEPLSLMAIETRRFRFHCIQQYPAAEAAEVVEADREKAAEKRVTLMVENAAAAAAGGPATTMLADYYALGIIIANLVDNAIKYTSEGGSVAASAGREGMYATIVVRDTGIGLSFLKRLVGQHQGSITVDSEPGNGSSFTSSKKLERLFVETCLFEDRSEGSGRDIAGVHRNIGLASIGMPENDVGTSPALLHETRALQPAQHLVRLVWHRGFRSG